MTGTGDLKKEVVNDINNGPSADEVYTGAVGEGS